MIVRWRCKNVYRMTTALLPLKMNSFYLVEFQVHFTNLNRWWLPFFLSGCRNTWQTITKAIFRREAEITKVFFLYNIDMKTSKNYLHNKSICKVEKLVLLWVCGKFRFVDWYHNSNGILSLNKQKRFHRIWINFYQFYAFRRGIFIKSLNISRRTRSEVEQFIKSFECQSRTPMIEM